MAPPASKSTAPSMPPDCWRKISCQTSESMPGMEMKVPSRKTSSAPMVKPMRRPRPDDIEAIPLGAPARQAVAAAAAAGVIAAAPAASTLDQAFILVREQMALHLRHRIHGDADHDQQRGAAEIEHARRIGEDDFRQQTHEREIDGADAVMRVST